MNYNKIFQSEIEEYKKSQGIKHKILFDIHKKKDYYRVKIFYLNMSVDRKVKLDMMNDKTVVKYIISDSINKIHNYSISKIIPIKGK